MSSIVALRYAKSVFNEANKNNSVDKICNDFNLISQSIKDSKELRLFLKFPLLSSNKKGVILRKIFSNVNTTTASLLELLTQKKRENLIPEICIAIENLHLQSTNTTKVEIQSAVSLDENEINKIIGYVKNQIEEKNILPYNTINTELIGGVIVNYKDKQLDWSVLGELNNIKRSLNIK